jgi:hypothetical protein
MEESVVYELTRRNEIIIPGFRFRNESLYQFTDLLTGIQRETIVVTSSDRLNGLENMFDHIQYFLPCLGFHRSEGNVWCGIQTHGDVTAKKICQVFLDNFLLNDISLTCSDVDYHRQPFTDEYIVNDVFQFHIGNKSGHYIITVKDFPNIKTITLTLHASVEDSTKDEHWRKRAVGSVFPTVLMELISTEPLYLKESTGTVWTDYVSERWVNTLIKNLPKSSHAAEKRVNIFLLAEHGFNARNFMGKMSVKPTAITKIVLIESLLKELCFRKCQDTRMVYGTDSMIIVPNLLGDESSITDIDHFLCPYREFIVNDPLSFDRAFRRLTSEKASGWPNARVRKNTTIVTTMLACLGFGSPIEAPWPHRVAAMRVGLCVHTYVWDSEKMRLCAHQPDLWVQKPFATSSTNTDLL